MRTDLRRVKIHHPYTVNEVAELLGKHKNTVLRWIKHDGLPALMDRRPWLIVGAELAAFLTRQRARNKRSLRHGEIYCVKCRDGCRPALGMVDYIPKSPTSGMLRGLCERCETLMHRRVRKADLGRVAAGLDVTITDADATLTGGS